LHPSRLEIQQRLRWIIPAGIAIGAILIIALWFRYFHLAGSDNAADEIWSRPIVWLALALVATIAAPPILFVTTRNYVWLIRHGTEISGRVLSVGSVTKGGATPVTYAYNFGGVEYTTKRDTPNLFADRYQPGTPVLVLIDARKPSRATVLDLEE